MNKITKAITGLALAAGLAVAATTPAQAATYSFTTSCPSNTHVRVNVSAASYVYTTVKTSQGNVRSGYGTWRTDFYGIKNSTITYTTSYASVNYVCANGN